LESSREDDEEETQKPARIDLRFSLVPDFSDFSGIVDRELGHRHRLRSSSYFTLGGSVESLPQQLGPPPESSRPANDGASISERRRSVFMGRRKPPARESHSGGDSAGNYWAQPHQICVGWTSLFARASACGRTYDWSAKKSDGRNEIIIWHALVAIGPCSWTGSLGHEKIDCNLRPQLSSHTSAEGGFEEKRKRIISPGLLSVTYLFLRVHDTDKLQWNVARRMMVS
jgi:hypothetical protein